jgi:hypothetical protein
MDAFTARMDEYGRGMSPVRGLGTASAPLMANRWPLLLAATLSSPIRHLGL